MKKKLIFLFLPFLLIVGGYSFYDKLIKINHKGHSMILKIATQTKQPISTNDPAHILITSQANVIRALYSRLFEISPNGAMSPSFAVDFKVAGNTLILNLQKNLKTIDGHLLTAEDVLWSFKRLLILKKNTHGDLSLFLKIPETVTIESTLNSIEVINSSTIKFHLIKKNYADFLLKQLLSIDFSIIPKDSIDWNSPELKIKDYKNTSGIYYLSKDDENGEYQFKVNQAHHFFSTTLAKEIHFVFCHDHEYIEKLNKGEIDLIPTYGGLDSNLIGTIKNTSDYDFYESMPINNRTLVFTDKGMRQYSEQERRKIGIELSVFFGNFEKTTPNQLVQFFPNSSDGVLNESQKTELQALLNDATKTSKNREIVPIIVVSPKKFNRYNEVLGSQSKFKLKQISSLKEFLINQEGADAVFAESDSSFFESISLVSYSAIFKDFNLDQNQTHQWIQKYIDIEDKKTRLEMLKELHYQALKSVRMFPIFSGPYRAIARKPWNMDFPRFFAGSPFWQIKYEE